MPLIKTWRWFGPDDPVKLDEIRQIGVEGIVTALHHIPNGEVWPVDEIQKTKELIESHGMSWTVVESLPVSEGIKTGDQDRERLIENYKSSLENLGKCGIDTVVYNFMPVIDWVRTDTHFKLPEGTEGMLFDYPTFAAFDIYILERPGAENDYPEPLLKLAKDRYEKMSDEEAEALAYNIIVLTQGFIDGTVGDVQNYKKVFLDHIARYKNISEEKLRENLSYFLKEIMPVADEYNIKMCAHPDDPPFPVLGLPRIISTLEDLKWLTQQYPSINNGITFCSGSLSARKDNDLPAMVRSFAPHIHFAHLRTTRITENGSFYEEKHLSGDVDMYSILVELLKEQKRRLQNGRKDYRIPFRPDHGLKLLDDYHREANPGYPLIGRLKGLAEISGLEWGIERGLMDEGG
ncbi:MAG: mannonate dehydratase [Bacteroidales bacterium]